MATSPVTRPTERASEGSGGQRGSMEIWISYVLRIGVLLAGAIILLGLALFVLTGPSADAPRSLHQVLAGGGLVVTPRVIANGVAHADPIAIIQLGVLVLILTPMLRVAMTMLLFFGQRDWIFAAITLTVLAILLFGLVGRA